MPPVLPDSRKLTTLAEVIQSEEGLAYLRGNELPDLDVAKALTGQNLERVVRSLVQAAQKLEEVGLQVQDYTEDKAVIDNLRRCAKRIAAISRDFPEVRRDLETALSRKPE